MGDHADKLEEYGPCYFIEEFVSGGPKNYVYSVFWPSNGKRATQCKVKDKPLNHENTKVVNFPTLRDMILENARQMHVHNPRKIKWKHRSVVVWEPETKECNFVFKKRPFMDYFDPHPYGY